ncbi:MAG: 2-methylaconitate cis-trans isomerase PrpF, partial [Gammaproteobacteria bacterium]
TYMRGGTSKGVFFKLSDLPNSAQVAGAARDALLLRVIGSPDPYAQHIDGMGGASSSTSKVVIVSKSERPGHDVDYLFGQVAIDQAVIDWSGNCGNLSAAVGAFAVHAGLVNTDRLSKTETETAVVRVWQKNIEKTIIVQVPCVKGVVQETGAFELDGVTFPAAEIKVEFVNPVSERLPLFPTGNRVDTLNIPRDVLACGSLQATLINVGIPSIFVSATALGYTGTESQADINNDVDALKRLETIRAHGALKMGLIQNIAEATRLQHTPKIVLVAPPVRYTSSRGKVVDAADCDVCVRALSMGKLHHAMMGTAAVAIGVAAAIPGTLVYQTVVKHLDVNQSGDKPDDVEPVEYQELNDDTYREVICGHPSGILKVGAVVQQGGSKWDVRRVIMSRSARILMEGWVRVPENAVER